MEDLNTRDSLTIQDVINLSDRIKLIASDLVGLTLDLDCDNGRQSFSQISGIFDCLARIAVDWAFLEGNFISGDASATVQISGSTHQESAHHAVINEVLSLSSCLFSAFHRQWPRQRSENPRLPEIPSGLTGQRALLAIELRGQPDFDLLAIEQDWKATQLALRRFCTDCWKNDLLNLFPRLRRENSAAIERLAYFHGQQFALAADLSQQENRFRSPSTQLEADGPVADRRWRYGGQVLPGKMKPQVHKLATYLFKFKDHRDVTFDELMSNGVVGSDVDRTSDQTIQKHGSNVTIWFRDRSVPFKVYCTTRDRTMTLSTISSDEI